MRFVNRTMLLSLSVSVLVKADMLPLPANDTYLDSSNTGAMADFSHADHGKFGVIKAVYDTTNSTQYGVSRVHGLFTLPSDLFKNAPGTFTSAVVRFEYKTNTLSANGNSATAELFPLMHNFVAGTGGNTGLTQDTGAPNGPQKPNSGTSIGGADWYTYDGKSTDTWTTVGGDFDTTASSLDASFSAGGTASGYASFDITTLLNTAATYAEARDNGLIVRVVQDTDTSANAYANNATLSLISADTPNTKGTGGSVIFSAVPEPMTAGTLSLVTLFVAHGRRRRKTC